jgi:16S rRNA (cytidine1402-2'-O)-methyltransferase
MTREDDAPLAPGLHVTATPIGNLKDITLRALETLERADRILCEDTRLSGHLMRHFGIKAPLVAYHDHNEAQMLEKVLGWLEAGERLALISDAGTPLISDPGFRLVRAAREKGFPVHAVPGPSALTAALSIAGLATDRFYFEGFLPAREKARRDRLAALKTIDATLVFYESPHRVAETLADMAQQLGERDAALARELTKTFEEVRQGSLPALAAHYAQAGAPKGEIVLLVAPPIPQETDWTAIETQLARHLETLRLKEAVERTVAETGAPRRDVYQRALALKEKNK